MTNVTKKEMRQFLRHVFHNLKTRTIRRCNHANKIDRPKQLILDPIPNRKRAKIDGSVVSVPSEDQRREQTQKEDQIKKDINALIIEIDARLNNNLRDAINPIALQLTEKLKAYDKYPVLQKIVTEALTLLKLSLMRSNEDMKKIMKAIAILNHYNTVYILHDLLE